MSLRETRSGSSNNPKDALPGYSVEPSNLETFADLYSEGYSPTSSSSTIYSSDPPLLGEMPVPLRSVVPNALCPEFACNLPSDRDNDGLSRDVVRHPLSSESVSYVRHCMKIPRSCETLAPNVGDSRHSPPLGYFTVYVEHFNSGLSIPPAPLLVELLQNLGVSFSQLTPNALLYFFGFCHRVSVIDLVPSVELFHALFSARCTKPESDVYFQPRPKCRFLCKLRSYRGDWKSDFFFARDCG